jgi:hypothetical protein
MLPYGLAVAAVALALLLTLLSPPLKGDPRFIFFFAAVAVTAWAGDLEPALLVIALSVASTHILVLSPP